MANRILLTTEGTYPHYHGGVSVWCDQLVRSLRDYEFDVLSIVDSPSRRATFKKPANLRSVIAVPQWGTEEAGLRMGEPFSRTYLRKASDNRQAFSEVFLPAFETVVRQIFAGADSTPTDFGPALARLRHFFSDHDYHSAMASHRTWRTFVRYAHNQNHPLTMSESTSCMRWLARFLGILTAPLPKDADVVHSSIAGLAGLPGVLLKIERGTPYILSEHGVYLREVYLSLARSEYSDGCRRFLSGFYHAVARANYHYADVVTTLGRFNARWQQRFGADSNRMVLTPNGVDPERFHPGGGRSDRPTILTLARIYPLKGIDVLLEAAALVKNRVPNVCVRVLGEVADAAYFARCQEIVKRHGLENNVEFGSTQTPEIEYRRAHVYCLPSISEAMPFVIIEAMLSACPVVATNVGNVADVLEGVGLLARPNDPQALAGQLLAALDGEGATERRSDMARRGMERAMEHYTLDRAMANFDRLYQQVGTWRRAFQTA